MHRYLSWYGLETDMMRDSSLVVEQLEGQSYDLLIGDLLMTPVDPLSLFRSLRLHPMVEVRNLTLLAIGLNEPSLDEFVALHNLKVGYISKYRGVELFAQRVKTLITMKAGSQ